MKHALRLRLEDSFPDTIGISYPCHKDYNFMMGPQMWRDCNLEEEHGHILLQCDDGTALLPHVIHSKSDIEQVLEDLLGANTLGFRSEPLAKAVGFILRNDPVTKALPIVTPYPVAPHNLKQLCFWMWNSRPAQSAGLFLKTLYFSYQFWKLRYQKVVFVFKGDQLGAWQCSFILKGMFIRHHKVIFGMKNKDIIGFFS